MPDGQSTAYRLLRRIVIFRTLTPGLARFAHALARLNFSVMYLEAAAPFRQPDIADELASCGIHQVDFSKIPGYDAYAHVKFVGELASDQVNRLLPTAPLARTSQLFPVVHDRPRKIRALLHELISGQIWSEAFCYTVADHLRQSGHWCMVWPARPQSLVFLSSVMSRLELMIGVAQAARFAGAKAISALTRRVRTQQGEAQARFIDGSSMPAASPAPLPASALVLMFPHKGPFFGTQIEKDQYYSADPSSALNRNHILHVELADALAGPVRDEVLAAYRAVGLEPHILGITTARRGIVQWWTALLVGWRNGLSPLAALLVEVLRGRIERAREALGAFPRARLALLGYDYLFPVWIAYALQAQGIQVVATQERLIQAFLPNRTIVIDDYFVHGKAARDAFNLSPYACIERMHIIGDVRADELITGPARGDGFPRGVSHRTLVLDWHSDPDPFNKGHHTTNNWPNNRLFYRDILRLARSFPESYFLLRGKNVDWLELAAFADIRREMDALPNISVNLDDRPRAVLELAAAADSVIARYTSLGDQCMAAGKPVIYHEGSVNGGPLVASVMSFHPYKLMVRSYDELAVLYRRVLAEGRVMDEGERLAMNGYYFSAPLPADGVRLKLLGQLEAMLGGEAGAQTGAPEANVIRADQVVATAS